MKFKLDENLPIEIAMLLQSAQHDAVTVVNQQLSGADDQRILEVCLQEERALVKLDLDFADVRTYPPQQSHGIIVLRVRKQDKRHLINVFNQVLPHIGRQPLEHHLWIVEESRIRIRGGEEPE